MRVRRLARSWRLPLLGRTRASIVPVGDTGDLGEVDVIGEPLGNLLDAIWRQGLLSTLSFISTVVFRRAEFDAVDREPYLGLMLYPLASRSPRRSAHASRLATTPGGRRRSEEGSARFSRRTPGPRATAGRTTSARHGGVRMQGDRTPCRRRRPAARGVQRCRAADDRPMRFLYCVRL